MRKDTVFSRNVQLRIRKRLQKIPGHRQRGSPVFMWHIAKALAKVTDPENSYEAEEDHMPNAMPWDMKQQNVAMQPDLFDTLST